MNKTCSHCGTSCLIAKDKAANGSTQVFWWCVHCNNYADPRSPFIPHGFVKVNLKIDIDTLPTIERFPNNPLPVCVVCGKSGAELHHFAPKHIFDGESENWPTAYLCDKHHREWHTKVTPDMRKRQGGQ